MATFTKTTQNILDILNAGASIGSALGLGSTLKTPKPGQTNFDSTRQAVLSGVRRFGIQKTNLAYFTFPLPVILDTIPGIKSSQVLLLTTTRAESFVQPSVAMATSEIKRYGIGPLEKKPYLPIFTDMDVEFIADSRGDIHKFFYAWLNGIINFIDLPRENQSRSYDSFGKNPFSVEYKDSYTTTLTIRTFSETQEKLVDVFLHNAYPISISDMRYNWNDENQLVRFTVRFTFTHWNYNIQEPGFKFSTPQADISYRNNDLVYQLLIQAYPAAQAIELAVRKPTQIQDVLNIVNAGRTSLSPITRYF